MSRRAEYEAAYFARLRAVEERDELLRYREYLTGELRRLDEFAQRTRADAEPLSRAVRRPIDRSAKPLLEVVGRRRALVLEQLGRVDGWIADAEGYVAECESELATLAD
ncbi:MAG: hypothetical protein M3N17_00340 [Actinomycetota bacterium]|nr:hypothetical protein [Actinomycetota bacterium]